MTDAAPQPTVPDAGSALEEDAADRDAVVLPYGGVNSLDAANNTSCQLGRPYSVKDEACNACAASECCAEINTCLSDPDCDDGYFTCLIACALVGDAGIVITDNPQAGIAICEDGCAALYPSGWNSYYAVTACVDQKCAICK